MLQALKVPLFYPKKMVTKFEGLGSSCDVILVAKVCLPSVTFSEFLPLRRLNDVWRFERLQGTRRRLKYVEKNRHTRY